MGHGAVGMTETMICELPSRYPKLKRTTTQWVPLLMRTVCGSCHGALAEQHVFGASEFGSLDSGDALLLGQWKICPRLSGVAPGVAFTTLQ